MTADDYINPPDACEFCRYRRFSQMDSTFVCINSRSQLFGEEVFPNDWCDHIRKVGNGKESELNHATD